MAEITKDTLIGELLNIDDTVAPVLLDRGMHCLGCAVSRMETIGEAAMVHGVDPDELLAAINDHING